MSAAGSDASGSRRARRFGEPALALRAPAHSSTSVWLRPLLAAPSVPGLARPPCASQNRGSRGYPRARRWIPAPASDPAPPELFVAANPGVSSLPRCAHLAVLSSAENQSIALTLPATPSPACLKPSLL